jgi:hypothetical protein
MRERQRLDPVRWSRPGRGALFRLAVVAALLTTAAVVLWSRPRACLPAALVPSARSAALAPAAALGPSMIHGLSAALAPAAALGSSAAHAPSVPSGRGAALGPGTAAASLAADGCPGAVVSPPPEGAGKTPDSAEPGDAGPPAATGRARLPLGTVGVPIRLAEPAALKLIRPGDRVDLFPLTGDDRRSPPLASAALVLEVTGADDPATGGLLLALTPEEAERTVTNRVDGYAVLIRPDG